MKSKRPVQKAKIADVAQVHQLVNLFAERGEMLARPLSELYENIRDLFVVRQGEQVVGCASLHLNWADLAEIKSLAVAAEHQQQQIGAQLVKACLAEAQELGLTTVFCLTYKPEFFEKMGFQRVDKKELPQKVWSECFRCPKFPDCDEVALVYKIDKESPPRARNTSPSMGEAR